MEKYKLLEKLRNVLSKDVEPRELQWAKSTQEFVNSHSSIPQLADKLQKVASEAFGSRPDFREMLIIYADRLRWHVLDEKPGMDERDLKRLTLQTRDTERELRDKLLYLRYDIKKRDPKAGDRLPDMRDWVNGTAVHLRLLALLVKLGDQASKAAVEKYSKEFREFRQEYVDEWKARCSVSVPESGAEFNIHDSETVITVPLDDIPCECAESNQDLLIETYLNAKIFSDSYFQDPIKYGAKICLPPMLHKKDTF